MDISILTKRLSTVMRQDVHQTGNCYEVRSIYFDDLQDSCMLENEAGVDIRKKYRIRTYAPELSTLNLEIKEKQQGLTKKISCKLTQEELQQILHRDTTLTVGIKAPLNQLLYQMRRSELRPKLAVVYERTAFVHPVGNVRITFDRNIMASKNYSSLFETHVRGLVPVLPKGVHVLEVKYDEMLPTYIASQLEIFKLRKTAFSKYYLGRCASNGEIVRVV